MSGPPTKIKDAIRRALYEAHGELCWLCKRPMSFGAVHPDPLRITIDHVVPLSLGGTWDFWNLRLAHYECNNAHGNSIDVDEITRRLSRLLRGEPPIPRKRKPSPPDPAGVVATLKMTGKPAETKLVAKRWTFWVDGKAVTGQTLI